MAVILLVEDDVFVRNIAEMMIGEFGHNTLPADDMEEALVSIREHLESLESLMILWRRSDSQEPSDVDEGESLSLRPQQAALSQ
jgi:CheY-like chemotaxis protein